MVETTSNLISAPLDCPVAPKYRDNVAIIGNLDGVHKGHQLLIEKAKTIAQKAHAQLAAIIFDPHPRQVFDPSGESFLLNTTEQKAALLTQYGVKTIFALPFNRKLSMLTPEQFVKNILSDTLGVKGVVVGSEFQFGQRRSGTAETLKNLCQNQDILCHIVDPIGQEGAEEKYSSSAIRKALKAGKPELANTMLGSAWCVTGLVQKGQQLGRTLNFPTANISMGDYIHPAKGVYAVCATVDGNTYKAVANFGSRPTVDGKGVLLEVFLFDFKRDIYGEALDVAFHHFIRPEQKFANLDALKSQIAADSEKAAMLLA